MWFPRRVAAARRAARRLLPLAPVVVLLACGGTGVSRVADSLYGEVRFDGDVLVAPDLRWQAAAEGDGWELINEARFAVYVAAPSDRPLVLRVESAPGEEPHGFGATWDDRPLPAGAVSSPRDGVEVVRVPPGELEPGLHVLDLRRERFLHRPTQVRRLLYRHGERTVVLRPGDAARLHRIADFLLRGVVGGEVERRSGVLFVGPRQATLPLPAEAAGELRLEPENLSPAPSTWRLALGGREAALELGPGERGSLALPLPEDATAELSLAVDGEAEGLFLWGLPRYAGAAASAPTPVVVITLDTTRRDAVYPYSGDAGRTPRLAELAARSTVFENAYSTAPWTLPSHASIMTGLYPSRHRAGVSEDQIATAAPTLAGRLRDVGYLTAGFSAGYLTSYRFGLGLGFALYRDPEGFETAGDRVLEEVKETVDAYADWPLFLFVNLFDAHALYTAPAPFAARLGVAERARALDGDGDPLWRRMAAGDGGAWKAIIEGEAVATPEALEWLRAAYHAEVAFDDHLVGEIVDLLERHDLFERSLFIVTADHGELLGEGGYYSHSARLDPELVEIPLLVKWPHQREAQRVTAPVSLVDLYPTVLAAAGLEPPAPVDGRLLTADGPEGSPRPYLFFEEHEHRVHPLDGRMKIASHLYGVQKPSFRQVAWEAGGECARLENGPDGRESWRRIPCPEGGDVVLEQIEAVLGPRIGGRPADAGVVSDDMRKSLEALGYL